MSGWIALKANPSGMGAGAVGGAVVGEKTCLHARATASWAVTKRQGCSRLRLERVRLAMVSGAVDWGGCGWGWPGDPVGCGALGACDCVDLRFVLERRRPACCCFLLLGTLRTLEQGSVFGG